MQEIIAGLSHYDTATVLNALVLKMGLPNEEYLITAYAVCCWG